MLDARQVDVLVVGAGLAGLVTTLELLECSDVRILLVDRCEPDEVGGLAREAFGGMFMVDTREQRFSGIRDSVALALEDWQRVAEFDQEDEWPRRWAQEYVTRARDDVADGSSLTAFVSFRSLTGPSAGCSATVTPFPDFT